MKPTTLILALCLAGCESELTKARCDLRIAQMELVHQREMFRTQHDESDWCDNLLASKKAICDAEISAMKRSCEK